MEHCRREGAGKNTHQTPRGFSRKNCRRLWMKEDWHWRRRNVLKGGSCSQKKEKKARNALSEFFAYVAENHTFGFFFFFILQGCRICWRMAARRIQNQSCAGSGAHFTVVAAFDKPRETSCPAGVIVVTWSLVVVPLLLQHSMGWYQTYKLSHHTEIFEISNIKFPSPTRLGTSLVQSFNQVTPRSYWVDRRPLLTSHAKAIVFELSHFILEQHVLH